MQSLSCAAFGVLVCLGVAHDSCAAQGPVPPVHPKGTFVRPTDGIRNLALDQAWQAYTASITAAADAIRGAMDQRLARLREKGASGAVQKTQAWRAMLDGQGILPGDEALRPDVIRAGNAFRKANAKLLDQYEACERELTRAGRDAEANNAKDERGALVSGLEFPPMPNVPESLFDGKHWVGWGKGWGGGKHEVIDQDDAIRLVDARFFAHERVLDGDVTLEVDVRARDWDNRMSRSQFGFQTNAGACLVRLPAITPDGQVMNDRAEVIYYDQGLNQDNVLTQFDCPRPVNNAWRACQFSRRGGTFSLVVDGRQVANDQPLPAQVLRNYNLQVGVAHGAADFRNLKVTRNVP